MAVYMNAYGSLRTQPPRTQPAARGPGRGQRPHPARTAHGALIGADRTYKALADPTRRRILCLLAEARPLPVATIAEHLECISQPNLSHHLRVLREAGLVSAAREGRTVYYEIDELATRQFLVHIYETYVKPRRPYASSIVGLLR